MRLLYSSIAETEAAQVAFADYSDAQQLRALVAASGRIDSRLGSIYSTPLSTRATGTVLFTGIPADGETVVVSSVTYRFKTTAAQAFDVTRGATAALTAVNFARALNASSQGGYYTGTTINPDVEATAETASVPVRVRFGGTAGNVITLSSTSSALTITGFSGGASDYSQLGSIAQMLAVSFLLRGQNPGPGQNISKDQPQDYYKIAMDWLSELALGNELLTDDTGTAASMDPSARPWSDTSEIHATPFADEGDPCYWEHDTDKDFSR
jgi:hypothetical protein